MCVCVYMSIFDMYNICIYTYIYIYIRPEIHITILLVNIKHIHCWSGANSKINEGLYVMLFKIVILATYLFEEGPWPAPITEHLEVDFGPNTACLIHRVTRCRGYRDACV